MLKMSKTPLRVVSGPSTGGALVQAVGFPCLMVFIGVINILYAPLCLLLRNPAVREEKLVINEDPDEVLSRCVTAFSPEHSCFFSLKTCF